ncbi:hypothetical protein [Actinokineospora pegani]|uniref:hypothetical protein n=1 Tax=Actinokineospora pegani TaxID=2654637 RepID=UPI0012EA53A3|nr:hypothetical protein [Actinokineospora pegani]
MSLLARLRTRHQGHVDFAATPVGHALVLHGPGGMGETARALAPCLPADTQRELVVADLPGDPTAAAWGALAAALPRGPRGIRLVITGTTVEPPADLATRFDRSVEVAVEPLPRGARAVLLLGASREGGWVGFPRSAGFAWVVAGGRAPGEPETVEPLPAGVWLRPDGEPRWMAVNRAELAAVPDLPGTLTLVLGGQHLPPLTLDTVARFWSTLAPADRARARFARYGRVRLPGHDLGQALADVLGEEVACYNGLPTSAGVHTVQSNGSLGWNTFAQLYSHRPHEPGAAPAAPRLRGHRPPAAGLEEVAPGVYGWELDAVVEVVRAGLWVRSPKEPAHAPTVRAAPANPATHHLFHDPGERMRDLAHALATRLDVQVRLVNRVVPAPTHLPAPPRTAPRPPAAEVSLPWLAQLIHTTPAPLDSNDSLISQALRGAFTTIPLPEPELDPAADEVWESADDTEPSRQSDQEHVRATWPAEFAAASEPVASVLAGHPKLTDPAAPEDSLTDAIALQLHLQGLPGDAELDRRAASAAARLPVHRGGTLTTFSPTPAQWDLFRERDVLSKPTLLHLLAAPCATQRGEVDLLVWSMTGRRSAALEPADGAVADRVLFLPGTHFKVLDLSEPTGDGRGRVVLRELSPLEVDADGAADPNKASLDRFARTSLERAVERWARDEPRERVPAAVAHQFRLLP